MANAPFLVTDRSVAYRGACFGVAQKAISCRPRSHRQTTKTVGGPEMGAELRWPSSSGAIQTIQRERKRRAVEQAMRAPFFRQRLSGISLDRLDDPQEWAKIPLLTKDELRAIPIERFHDEFCVAPRTDVVEYWRSGGVTGRPLFYPRSALDMEASIMCFRRAFEVIAATHDDLV